MPLPELADDHARRALASAAQWLGIGVAAVPVLDLADRAGLFVLLVSPELLELSVLWPLLQIAFFVGLGVAASALLRRHRPTARSWFFVGCVTPVAIFTLHGGLRLSAAVALIALSFAFVQLRLAREAPPLA
ncbi:hypothetical protein [Paraliomyxa miuraensis]|uniref:hypothetical protein n=1 Tax=Paraliomyxa miuraensis TaxID=376150 RepID=UPI0022517358|nr:hypothetical protein [Paraliomyxa miuraensis]MCX4241846.1 hypothetical protein [Paraliomyxa miuraensis]